MFWELVENETNILERKAEDPLRSRTSKGFEEIRCYFGFIFGGPEAGEGGL